MNASLFSTLENFRKGNRSSARLRARRFGWRALFTALRDSYGYSEAEARRTADYLKGIDPSKGEEWSAERRDEETAGDDKPDAGIHEGDKR